MMKPRILRHVAFNSVANLLVMAGSLDLAGRLDQRLSNIVQRTAIIHGVLAFLTLITRHYYSIPMLLTGAPISVLGGAVVTILGRRASAPRIGIIGPWHWIAEDRALRCSPVAAPTDSIRDYAVLLITFEGPIPASWTPVLSRALLAGKTVRHIAEYLEEVRGVVAIEHFELEHLPATGLASYRTPKRLFDILVALFAIPIAAPVTALAAAGVWITMGWPVWFIQDRVGLGGAPFRMLKLRTMRRPGPGDSGGATAPGDSRITPYGYWLRRFRIDELPQLINVLVGQMSLIGPRPEQPALAAAYIRDVPAFAFRHLVRPGITGWAQVRAGYAADLQETRVKLVLRPVLPEELHPRPRPADPGADGVDPAQRGGGAVRDQSENRVDTGARRSAGTGMMATHWPPQPLAGTTKVSALRLAFPAASGADFARTASAPAQRTSTAIRDRASERSRQTRR